MPTYLLLFACFFASLNFSLPLNTLFFPYCHLSLFTCFSASLYASRILFIHFSTSLPLFLPFTCLCASLHAFLSPYLPVTLTFCLPRCLSTYLLLCASITIYASLPVYSSVPLYLFTPLYLAANLSTPSASLHLCISTSLPLSPSASLLLYFLLPPLFPPISRVVCIVPILNH